MILGIDVGVTGCIVVLSDDFEYINHLQMPSYKVGAKSRVNGVAVAAWIAQYKIDHVYIEHVNGMPSKDGVKMGAASAFSFGHNAGVIEGVIHGAQIPYTLVLPSQWKKHAGLIGKEKDATRSRAIQLYPQVRELDLIKKGQALADAIFIARYAKTP